MNKLIRTMIAQRAKCGGGDGEGEGVAGRERRGAIVCERERECNREREKCERAAVTD